jgi:membrane protein YqaA with SNARE-associated domain
MEGEKALGEATSGDEGDLAREAEERARWEWRSLASRKYLLRILLVVLVVAITTSIFVFRDQLADRETLETMGYLGAFVIALVTSATVVLPVPGIAVIYYLGESLNPVLLGLLAGLGSALGEITGYMAGYSGQAVLEKNRYYGRVEQWMTRRGSIVILVLSFVPNPFFDLAGATAGALRFPLWKFLVMCFTGKTLRYMLVAFAGAYTMEWARDLFERYF